MIVTLEKWGVFSTASEQEQRGFYSILKIATEFMRIKMT